MNDTGQSERAAWSALLGHRQGEGDGAIEAVIERFEAAGVGPGVLRDHLADAGDRLYSAHLAGGDWASEFGGPHAVALIAAEISALMSHLVARAASIRAASVGELLDEYSAVTVAAALGVARQKVYELARTTPVRPYLTTSPWRTE